MLIIAEQDTNDSNFRENDEDDEYIVEKEETNTFPGGLSDGEIKVAGSEKDKYLIDFTTSSAISRINIKFLVVYLPIFWASGLLVSIYWYEYTNRITNWISTLLFLPVAIFCMYMLFILGCIFFSKLFLILINLIHEPKEGIFKAELGDNDFEFWCLRTELKKIVLWLIRNCPLPWIDTLAFRLIGMKIDFSSHLQDAWCDAEFIEFGRKVMIGQAAVVMSSMVVGKYLIIKKVIFDDYALIGGVTTVAPGTIFGKETVLGAVSSTLYNQVLEPEWIYTGVPARKFRKTKESLERRNFIRKVDVDEEKRIQVEHEVNVDEDKKHFLKPI